VPTLAIKPNDEDTMANQAAGTADVPQEQPKVVIGRVQNNGRVGFFRWELADDIPSWAVPVAPVMNFVISNTTVSGPGTVTIGRCTRPWTRAQTTWNSYDHGGGLAWPGGILDSSNRDHTWTETWAAGGLGGDPFPLAVPVAIVQDALAVRSGELQLMFSAQIGVGVAENWSLAGKIHATPSYRPSLNIGYVAGGPKLTRRSPGAVRNSP
jgi:hypothetical protein